MTKADIIRSVCEEMGFSRQEASVVAGAIFEVLKETLQQGEQITIVGFGSFRVRQKHERLGRDLHTGRAITIHPRKVVTFRPSRLLRDLMSGEEQG